MDPPVSDINWRNSVINYAALNCVALRQVEIQTRFYVMQEEKVKCDNDLQHPPARNCAVNSEGGIIHTGSTVSFTTG